MPLMYKTRIYTRRFSKDDINFYNSNDNQYELEFLNPRNLLIEFIATGEVDWFIENKIPLHVEKYEIFDTFEIGVDLIASLTAEQEQDWREQKIIKKLENSYSKF